MSKSKELKPQWTQLGPLRVHARVGGPRDGTPIVLVHGLGVSSRYFMPLATRLAGRHRVLAVDLPGYGPSDKPPRALGVRGLAAALAAWLDAVDLPSAVVVANSLGCQVTIDLAAREPARIERLVLVGPTVDPAFRGYVRHSVGFAVDAVREPLSLAAIATADYLRFGPVRYLATARSALNDRPEAKLPRVEAPTLVVRGGRDGFVTTAWIERMAELLPRGEAAVVPGAPHAAHFTAPDRVAALVEEHAHRVA